MVELPTLDGTINSPVCAFCAAKIFFEGKYCCDESELISNNNQDPKKVRPLLCPRKNSSPSTAPDAYTIARKLYRK